MKFRLVSWNVQGDAQKNVGISYSKIFANDRFNFLLLQEMGNPDTMHGKTINFGSSTRGAIELNCTAAAQVGADNLRCSLALCIPAGKRLASEVQCVNLCDSLRRPFLFTMVNFGFGRTLVATMHALSDHAGSKSQYEIATLIERLNSAIGRNEINNWILMGDFNNSPCDLAGYRYNMLFPADGTGRPLVTQAGGKCLDFAIFSYDSPIKKIATIKTLNVSGSDHCPVALDFENAY